MGAAVVVGGKVVVVVCVCVLVVAVTVIVSVIVVVVVMVVVVVVAVVLLVVVLVTSGSVVVVQPRPLVSQQYRRFSSLQASCQTAYSTSQSKSGFVAVDVEAVVDVALTVVWVMLVDGSRPPFR